MQSLEVCWGPYYDLKARSIVARAEVAMLPHQRLGPAEAERDYHEDSLRCVFLF
jgi:hypothetical protein